MEFGDEQMGDLPTRPMRVKVLYSFESDNKTNCLARFPDVLQIPVVAIDESSQVGVIELKQCLQAIVAASPELISRLSNGDFTIYAYDYSEYDSPLVGQGMLSTALTATTPTQQNKTMITGRVCKNVLGLFSNGTKETLEVKLRLTPVARLVQNEFTKSMDGMRSMSPAVSGGFDPNAWNASVQQSRPQQQMNDYFNFDTILGGDNKGMGVVDGMFDLTSGNGGSGGGLQMDGGAGIAETPSDALPGFSPAFAAHPHSAPGSRAGSPMMGSDPSNRNDLLRHQSFSGHPSSFIPEQSRPDSRGSVRSEVQQQPRLQRQASTSSHHELQTEVYYNEDGQSRKRAKIQQADWRGRSSFGSKSGDLRVTAATAASMHMHRPIPRKAAAPGSDLEPPPRVPTPVPQRTQMLSQQQQAPRVNARRSLLRQASTADSDFMSDFDNFSDTIVSSPDDDSPGNSMTADGSPLDIPSSPPVFAHIDHPQPSSPGLPTLPPPRMADSGYMSERGFTSGGVMESMEDEDDRSPTGQDNEMAAHYRSRSTQSQTFIKTESSGDAMSLNGATAPWKRIGFATELPGDMDQLPQKMMLNLPPGRRDGSQGPKASTTRPPLTKYMSTASLAGSTTSSRRGSLALPPNPPSQSFDNAGFSAQQIFAPRKRPPMNRSRTQSNESEAGSPAPSDTEGGRPRGSKRSGSGAPRRKKIEDRLQASIAKGETPPFCSHCGAIETPTWRRIFIKECDGQPSRLDEVEGEGETIGVEITETDPEGNATKFLIRKSVRKAKDNQSGTGFIENKVCNPCGLWFNKTRVMRPSDKWTYKSVSRRKTMKQKEAEDEAMLTDCMEPPSDALFYADQDVPENAVEDADAGDDSRAGRTATAAPARNRRARANSMQVQSTRRSSGKGGLNASQLNTALTREVQSSPPRPHGSQQSPIEIQELTPKPTRRLLFPSPRNDGTVKSLDDNNQASLKAMPHLDHGFVDKSGTDFNFGNGNTSVFEAFTFDKENMMPPLGDPDDDLAHLFDGSPTAFFKTPRKTPAKKTTTPRSLRQLHHFMKTPTPNRSTRRKPLTPNANAANNADPNEPGNDFMTSPASNRYFLRSTPSRIERTGLTPGRNGGSTAASPWSRHLAQRLSDANDGSSNQFTSPSGAAFDFSDLPSFNTPGGRMANCDWWGPEGVLSSDFAGFDGTEGAAGDTMI